MEQRKKRDTKRIGDRSEMEVAITLTRAGYIVSKPHTENCRYDLIADLDGVLMRVQVKTGRLRNGAIKFACYSTHSHRKGSSCRRYTGEIEAFAVYCADVHAVFLVPVGEVASQGFLRWLPAKNGQSRAVRWARKYLVESIEADEVGSAVPPGVSDSAPELPL